MLKKLTGKRLLALFGAVIILGLIALAAAVLLRADAAQAEAAALAAAGGGEIVGREMEREGLWNEYEYRIVNGDVWYEVEVNAFGSVTGLESGRAGGPFRD